jgi:predicted RNase H-like HicB family nuclease
MKFVIAIEPGSDNSAWGVVVPDLPGCFSAGDTLDQAIDNAREAIDLWCQTVIEDGGQVPATSALSVHQADPAYEGWIWAVADVPVERYLGPAEKINITLPRLLLARVDDYARAHGETRSGLLARAVQRVMSG